MERESLEKRSQRRPKTLCCMGLGLGEARRLWLEVIPGSAVGKQEGKKRAMGCKVHREGNRRQDRMAEDIEGPMVGSKERLESPSFPSHRDRMLRGWTFHRGWLQASAFGAVV